MNWYFFALSFFFMLITPLSTEYYLTFGTHHLPSGYITLKIWNTGFTMHINVHRNVEGTLEIIERKKGEKGHGEKRKARVGRFLRMAKALKKADKARRVLLKAIRFELLPSFAVLGFEDAAKTAEAVGSVRALRSVMPKTVRKNLRLSANFRGECGFQFHCILRTRLGMLLCAALMAAGAYISAGKKGQGAEKWDTLQSET